MLLNLNNKKKISAKAEIFLFSKVSSLVERNLTTLKKKVSKRIDF
nr:MAG TPA: hypothetical protein [Caudoviricetes sp.]